MMAAVSSIPSNAASRPSQSPLVPLSEHFHMTENADLASASLPSPLADFRTYSQVDIDGNDAAVALAHAKMDTEAPRFGDMTSNQLIVLNELKKEHRAELVQQAIRDVSAIRRSSGEDGEEEWVHDWIIGFDSTDGLGFNAKEKVQQLVVDVMTVKLGLLMLPHLAPHGGVHAQTAPSVAYSTALTSAHARRLVALYMHMSGGTVTRERVCIKIPATVEGLRAAALLEKDGVRTLATTVFCIEQALAAAEGANCTYIAPYVNALEAHFYDSEGVPAEARRFAESAPALALVRAMQMELRRRDGRTRLVTASFLDPAEVTSLTGIDRATLSPAILDKLASASMTEELRGLRQAAIECFNSDNLEPLTDEEEDYADAGDGKGGWLAPPANRLHAALAEECTGYLLADALRRFEQAERGLREIAAQALSAASAGSGPL